MPTLTAAEMPILSVEATLAAFASFALGLPWWLPLVGAAAAVPISVATVCPRGDCGCAYDGDRHGGTLLFLVRACLDGALTTMRPISGRV